MGNAYLDIIVGAKNKTKEGFGSVESSMATLRKGAQIAGTAMVGAGIAVGGASLKMAATFEGSMREVNTMLNLGDKEFQIMSQEVLDMSSTVGVESGDMAKSLYQIISAGVPAAKAIKLLGVSARAAVGGVTTTETAVDGITTVLNAFKMGADKAGTVADIMFTTVKRGKTTFGELSSSLFNVAPLAAASGVKFKTVAAALATMTKQGVPTKIATTQLRQAFVSLQKPTEAMSAAINELGYESGQAMLSEQGLQGTLESLRSVTGDAPDKLLDMFGSIEAGQAVMTLTGDNTQTFADDLEAVRMSSIAGVAATEAYTEVNKGASRQYALMRQETKNAGIAIGTALIPVVLQLTDVLLPLIRGVGNWIKEHKTLTVGILGAVTGGGALILLVTVIGKITAAARTLKTGLVALKTAYMAHAVSAKLAAAAQWMLNAATLAFPVIAIVAAVLAVIAVGVLLWKNWDKVTEFLGEAWAKIKSIFVDTITAIKGKITGTFGTIIDFVKEVPGTISGFFEGVGTSIMGFFTAIPEKISALFGGIVDYVRGIPGELIGFFSGIGTSIVDFFVSIPEKLGELFGSLPDLAKSPINAVIGIFNGMLDRISGLKVFELKEKRVLGTTVFPGWTLTLPTIDTRLPVLDTGAIVRGPTLAALAMNRKPEAVIPLDRMGGFRGNNAIIHINLDGESIASYAVNLLTEEVRLQGVL